MGDRFRGKTMILRLSLTVCFVALAVLMGTMVQAATLDGIKGAVLVNYRGGGYVAVDNRTQVQPGDSVSPLRARLPAKRLTGLLAQKVTPEQIVYG